MVKKPLVSIVILNYKGIEFISKCLDSVFKSDYLNKEVIVVNSCATDESREFIWEKYSGLKNFKLIMILQAYGTDRARNIGASNAKGEYLAFLDNDTEVDLHWLENLVKVLESDKSIGAAQSKLLKNYGSRDQYDCAGDYFGPIGFLIERSQESKDNGQFDFVTDIFSAKSAASIIKTSIFNEIGGFDEDMFKYLEETDLSWRVWLSGYRVVFVPESVVYHSFATPQKSLKRYYSNKIFRYYGCRNYIQTLIKNLEFINLIKIVPLHILCWLVLAFLFALKGSFRDCMYILKGIGWNVVNIVHIIKKRQQVNSRVRKVRDKEIFSKVTGRRGISGYLKKCLAYLWGVKE